MIISKTPFRISFFGGGTDHAEWYKNYGGAVLSTTFDKYCYISLRKLPNFFDHKFRVVYSKIESVQELDEIKHPSVRETLKFFDIKDGLEIHHDGDLPARSGIGSSSSFTVGLVKAIHAFNGKLISPEELANESIFIEQELIKECVGSQDQIAAAYGGFNKIEFKRSGEFVVNPVLLQPERVQSFNDHLMLFYTGISRFSSDIARSQLDNIDLNISKMKEMTRLVDQAIEILQDTKISINEIGSLMNQGWLLKKNLSNEISTKQIDKIYHDAINAGAIGGKILGAGGGGFILFFVEPKNHGSVRSALSNLTFVPFRFENSGSSIALYSPNGL